MAKTSTPVSSEQAELSKKLAKFEMRQVGGGPRPGAGRSCAAEGSAAQDHERVLAAFEQA